MDWDGLDSLSANDPAPHTKPRPQRGARRLTGFSMFTMLEITETWVTSSACILCHCRAPILSLANICNIRQKQDGHGSIPGYSNRSFPLYQLLRGERIAGTPSRMTNRSRGAFAPGIKRSIWYTDWSARSNPNIKTCGSLCTLFIHLHIARTKKRENFKYTGHRLLLKTRTLKYRMAQNSLATLYLFNTLPLVSSDCCVTLYIIGFRTGIIP
jgi:hypothetical protein